MDMSGYYKITLRSQITIVVLVFTFIASLALYFMLDQRERGEMLAGYGSTVINTVQNRGTRLQLYIDRMRKDVLFLSQMPPVQAIVRADRGGGIDPLSGASMVVWQQRLQDIFHAFMQAHPEYFQVRYIGIRNDGAELVRVDRTGDRVEAVVASQLQKKGGRDYFKQAVAYQSGAVYLSDIDVNREHGNASPTYTRTIRAIVPVHDTDGILFGLIAINMDIGRYLDEVVRLLPDGVTGHVADQQGFYMTHSDREKLERPGFDLRWQDDFPALILQQSHQQLSQYADHADQPSGMGVQTLSSVDGTNYMVAGKINFDPERPDRYLALIYGFPASLINSQMIPLQRNAAGIAIVLALLIGMAVFLTVKRMFSPLELLTAGANRIAEGQYDIALPQGGAGELGSFTRAFIFMLEKIRQREQEILGLNEELRRVLREHEIQKYAIDQHAIVSITDTRGMITYANDRFCEISGYSREELLGRKHNVVNSGFHPESFFKDMWRTIGQGKVWKGEVLNRAKNGEIYRVDSTIVPFLDDAGKPFQYIAIRSDITRLRHIQEMLHKEHAQLDRVLSTISSVLIGVGVEGEVNLWNRAAEKAFGIRREDALGKLFFALDIRWEWAAVDRSIVESRNVGVARLDNHKYVRADGTGGFIGASMSAIYEQGEYTGFLLIAADITRKIQLANQLQLSQKMTAIGELAAGVAHEVNTPLQYVGDNIRFLRDSFADIQSLCGKYHGLTQYCIEQGLATAWVETLQAAEVAADVDYLFEEIPVAIAQSLDGVGKAAGIVAAMKSFSHPGTDKVMSDINKAVENTITVSRNEWKYVAEVATEFDESMPLVECLPEINQVFLNMIVNAAHAIADKQGKNSEEKGLITIRTSHSDTYVQIEISDTGKGIPEELQSKVYDPFYTTKEVGKGTGQGLSISHNIIVDRHGGTLQLASAVGKGTTFTIRIPIIQPGQKEKA